MRSSRLPCCLLVTLCLALPQSALAKLRIVTTLQDFAALAQEVGGDRVETLALAKGYQDPHFVDAKPSFVLQLSRADLLIVAGLELEVGYLPPLVDQSRNPKLRPGSPGHLDASQGCEILGRPSGAVSRAMGDVHPYGNPHYWTDPENGRRIARAIAARLSELDAAGAPDFAARLADFEARLTAREAEWSRWMAPYAGTKVVAFHDSWPNFARRFGLDIVDHVEPKPGIPPTPSHLLELMAKMRRESIGLILVEPYFDAKTPQSIADKTGAKLVTLYPSVGGLPEITDYLKLFDVNLAAIRAALGARP